MNEEINAQDIRLSETDLTDFHVEMGKPLPDGAAVASRDSVIAAVKEVQDPELMLSIYDLGLVYRIDISEKGDVCVDMTLTSPTCPIAGEMPGMVAASVAKLEGVGRIKVQLVWDPPWTLDKVSEDLKIALGI